MKDSIKVRNAIGITHKKYLFYVLIPVCWGVYNIIAALLSILLESRYIPYIWGVMVATGLLTQIILFKMFLKSKGFMLTSTSNVGKVWIVIMAAIIEITFVLDTIAPIINDHYFMGIVAVLVGVGLIITGFLVQLRLMTIAGIIWFASANLFAAFVEYSYHIHIAVVLVTLIIFPLFMFGSEKVKNNAE